MKAVLRTLILLVINAVIFISLIATVEIAVRIIFPGINFQGYSRELYEADKFHDSFGHKPNYEGISMGARVVTDAYGFRIDPLAPAIKNNHAILFLGDSVSFGPGVTASETYPILLQQKLKDYKIINASCVGYYINDYFNVLDVSLQKFEFEGVIVNICLNDFSNASQELMRRKINTAPARAEMDKAFKADINRRYPNRLVYFVKRMNAYLKFNDFLIRHSKAYLMIKNIVTDVAKNYFLADAAIYDDPGMGSYISDKLKSLNDLAVKNGKWIVFVVLPYEFQLRDQRLEDNLKPQRIIKEAAMKNNITLVDLYDDLRQEMKKQRLCSKDLFLYGDPMHLSTAGHKLAAKALLDELKRVKKL